MRITAIAILFSVLSLLAGCGGGGGGTSTPQSGASTGGTASTPPAATPVASASNVLPVSVESGPFSGANTLFANVTVCAPGGASCQVIDHVLVDSGSVGLRVFASALSAPLAQALSQQSGGGNAIGECTQFADGFTWGPVRQAALRIAGKSLDNTAVQVIGDSTFAGVPADCASTGTSMNTPSSFGANGVLGVGLFLQDCGAGCAQSAATGVYYSCNASSCQATTLPVAQQVQNPVSLFADDNNGVVITLPSVPSSGVASTAGSLIFGIGTQANNAINAGTLLTVDPVTGYFTVLYKSRTLKRSFIDSGSNGIFVDDSSIPRCSTGFYCPPATISASATNQGKNGVSNTVAFEIANADALFANNFAAFDSLAGPNGDSGSFDWGIPFFYGRTVFTALEGRTTPRGTGPYFAY
jgi:hypothetical protein